MMKVTLLVPIYGVEQYIEQCAESLFNQSYPELEFIFCNDCTPDRSMELLQKVIDRHPERAAQVRILCNEENKGLGATRAHLISEVHTDYFIIVDSDDILPQDAVAILVKRMEETDADIVEGGYAEYSSGQTGRTLLPDHSQGRSYLRRALCQNVISLRVWGKLYKTEVLNRVPNLFMEGIDFAEDVCATSRLAAVTSRAWIDEVVYWYRTDNQSSYTNNISRKNNHSYFRCISQVLRFYHQRGHLPLCLEVGLLNAYRECRRSGYAVADADNVLQYVPEHLSARLLFWMFHDTRIPLSLTDYAYRLVRALAY